MKTIDKVVDTPTIPIDRTREIRCTNIIQHGRRKGEVCNRLLGVGDLGSGGAIEHMCPRCKQLSRITKIP